MIAIDLADSRLEAAKTFGANVTINNSRQDPVEIVRSLTGGLGADVAVEAVGVPATFELAATLIRPGGHIANIGVHGKPVTLHLEDLWSRNVTITTGSSTPCRPPPCCASSPTAISTPVPPAKWRVGADQG